MSPPRFPAFRPGVPVERLAGTLARVCLLAWGGLLPLALWMGCGDTVETPKHLILAGLAWILLAAALVDPDARRRVADHPLAGPLTGLLVATLAVSGTGIGWTGEEGSWAGGASLVAVWAGALGAAAWGDARLGRRVPAAIVLAAGLALGYEAVQAAGLDPVPWDPGRKSSYWLMATLGNPVYLAGFLVCGFWTTFAVWPRARYGTWLVRALLLAGALYSRQRSVWLGLAGGACALAWVRRPASPARPEIGVRVEAGWVAAAAVSASVAALAPGWRLFDLLSPGSRLEIWRAAAGIWRAHPLLGIGPDLFHTWFPSFATYGFFVADPPTLAGGNVLLRLPASVHNEPLGVAVAGGVALLGIYAWALVAAIRGAGRSHLLPAAAALWGIHLVNPSSAATGSIGWLMLALAASAAPPGRRRGSERAGSRLAAGGLALGLVAMTFALWSAARSVVVQAHRREAGRLAFIGDHPALKAHLRRWDAWAARAHPGEALADAALWRARWESAPGDTEALERAAGLLAEARRANPRGLFCITATADLERARGRLSRDREALRRAEAGLREAIGLAPAVASLWGDLAEVLELEGRTREARLARMEQGRRDPRGVFGPIQGR